MGVCVVSGTSAASLKWTLMELQFSANLHWLFCRMAGSCCLLVKELTHNSSFYSIYVFWSSIDLEISDVEQEIVSVLQAHLVWSCIYPAVDLTKSEPKHAPVN